MSPPPNPPSFTISALQPEDIPAAARLSAAAFQNDRQTEMKALAATDPFDMEAYSLSSLPGFLVHPRCVVLKAVDVETGDIAGVCNWGFCGFAPEEMPALEGRVQPPAAPAPPKKEEKKEEGENEGEKKEAKEEETKVETDPIKRLVALTSADMARWQDEVMPEGTRCLYIIGLSVSPLYQGRGVGSALLRFGTRYCDEKAAFAWVHSSEPAWGMYQKCGFQVIRSLDIDLDEYAPCPPPNEGPGAKWGHYVFRYMKYYGVKQ